MPISIGMPMSVPASASALDVAPCMPPSDAVIESKAVRSRMPAPRRFAEMPTTLLAITVSL